MTVENCDALTLYQNPSFILICCREVAFNFMLAALPIKMQHAHEANAQGKKCEGKEIALALTLNLLLLLLYIKTITGLGV